MGTLATDRLNKLDLITKLVFGKIDYGDKLWLNCENL